MLKRFAKKLFPKLDERGTALVEFAMVLPILLSLLLTGIEVGRYVLLNLKLQHASYIMGDIVSRDEDMTNCDLDGLFGAIEQAVQPFEFDANGVVIVSGISKRSTQNNPKVRWQRSGAGSLSHASTYSAPVSNANLPAGFVLDDGESVLVVELFYQTEPWLLGFIPQQTVSKTSFFRPRLGSIESYQPGINCNL